MRHRNFVASLSVLFVALTCAPGLRTQEVIDRIVARVEDDVILLSDVRDLQQYQELVEGKAERPDAILNRLIDQWIVRSEAELSRFPEPKEDEIARGVTRVRSSFASPEEYEARKKKCGLSDAQVRQMVAGQLYLTNYLDSRFRPSAQVDQNAIVAFYQNAVVPRAKARGQEAPTLDAARDVIQEALIEKDINDQADRWLKESRGRLHVEKYLDEGQK